MELGDHIVLGMNLGLSHKKQCSAFELSVWPRRLTSEGEFKGYSCGSLCLLASVT